MPVVERDVALVRHAAHEPFVEHEARMVYGRAVDGVIGEEHLHAASGKLGLEARLGRDARRERVCDAVEVVGQEIAAVALGPEPNELDAGLERPQRLEEGLHGAARRTRRGMHAEAASQAHAGGLECFAAHQSRRTCGLCCMARIVF